MEFLLCGSSSYEPNMLLLTCGLDLPPDEDNREAHSQPPSLCEHSNGSVASRGRGSHLPALLALNSEP